MNDKKKKLIFPLILSIAVFIIIFIFYWLLSDNIIALLKPLNVRLAVYTLYEGLLIHITISIYSSIITIFPLIIYSIYNTIIIVYKNENKGILSLSIYSTLSFYIGVAAAHVFVVSYIFNRHLNIMHDKIISAIDYYNFLFNYSFMCGIICAVPVTIFFLTKIGLMKKKISGAKILVIVIAAFFIGALLMPYDLFLQIIIGLIITILFLISLFIPKIFIKEE